MIISFVLLSSIGFLISLYAFIIEEKIKHDKGYKPLCDISDAMSCSKPIMSKYGNIIGLSNTIVGMIFYAIIFICAWLNLISIVLYLSCASIIASLIFAYILYVKIKTFCILCTTIYAINVLLFIFSYLNL